MRLSCLRTNRNAAAYAAAAAALMLMAAAAPAEAARKKMRQAPERPVAAESRIDCTPINGWGGYYGNPWCRTGPSEAVNRAHYGYPAWVSKKYREW